MTCAVDTNILVRFLTGDDPVQAAMARDRLVNGFILSATVILETEWVLRAVYRWDRARIHQAMSDMSDMPGAVGLPAGLNWILERFAAGADLADMMHVSMAAEAEAFLTFDKRVAAGAGPSSPVMIEILGT